MGVALRARNLSKIFGCVHRTVHWGRESPCGREINQKLSSKIKYLVHRTVHLWRESLCEREIFQNLFKIKQNRHATRGKIVQTEGNQACLNC